MLKHTLLVLTAISCVASKVIELDWEVGWVTAAPDGFSRPVIGINGQWPCPTIEAVLGDTLVAKITNKLGNETTSVHWHGILQKGTGHMDGATQVTQCPIAPGASFTYNYTFDTPGTFWYHSHNMGQYPDGFRGPLVVHDPNDPFPCDEEFVLTTSDWYHDEAPTLIRSMLSSHNPNALPPLPDSILLNDSQNVKLVLDPQKTYKIRVISMAALASTMFSFDCHKMRIIEIDGVYTNIQDATQIRVSPAQRYTFILEATGSKTENHAFTASLDVNPDFTQSSTTWKQNLTGYIIYDEKKPLPENFIVDVWTPFDDTLLLPLDNQTLLGKPDQTIELNFNFGLDEFKIPRAFMNNATYVSQKVPTLYSVLSAGKDATNPNIYGAVNPFVVTQGQIVEIVLNNQDPAVHPFHLHGHKFQVIARPESGAGKYPGDDAVTMPAIPMRRDTVNVNGRSHVVLRFTADNPGVQLFHCHIEWHVDMGLTATIIEDPLHLQSSIRIPGDHLQNCKDQCIPTAGNAAGNTRNFTDLTGANTTPQDLDNGATLIHDGMNKRLLRWERSST